MPFPIWNTFLPLFQSTPAVFKTQLHCPLLYLDFWNPGSSGLEPLIRHSLTSPTPLPRNPSKPQDWGSMIANWMMPSCFLGPHHCP